MMSKKLEKMKRDAAKLDEKIAAEEKLVEDAKKFRHPAGGELYLFDKKLVLFACKHRSNYHFRAVDNTEAVIRLSEAQVKVAVLIERVGRLYEYYRQGEAKKNI